MFYDAHLYKGAAASSSDAVMSVQPVTFMYKEDALNTPQFRLIAQEVDTINDLSITS